MQENPHLRYELTTLAANCATSSGLCRDHCAGIQGKFVPIGKKKGTDLMFYARTELVGNTQYYFYQQDNGNWEFTWDQWVPNLDNVDLDNFGNCKFYKQFSEY